MPAPAWIDFQSIFARGEVPDVSPPSQVFHLGRIEFPLDPWIIVTFQSPEHKVLIT